MENLYYSDEDHIRDGVAEGINKVNVFDSIKRTISGEFFRLIDNQNGSLKILDFYF